MAHRINLLHPDAANWPGSSTREAAGHNILLREKKDWDWNNEKVKVKIFSNKKE